MLENHRESIRYLKSTYFGYFRNYLVNFTADLTVRVRLWCAYSFVERGKILRVYNVTCFNMLHAFGRFGVLKEFSFK